VQITRKRLAHALDVVFSTPEREILCSECSTLIPALVDAQITGADAAARYPDAWLHIQRCPDCREEYEELLAMMRLAEAKALSEPERYPQFAIPPVGKIRPRKKRPWLERARETVTQIAMWVKQGQVYAGGSIQVQLESGIEKITFVLTPVRLAPQLVEERGALPSRYLYALEDLELEVTVGVRAFARGQKTVKGQIFLAPGEVQSLAGTPVHLLRDAEQVLSAAVDETGSFTFMRVSPGSCSIVMELGDNKAIRLDGIQV
jgi:hypothetical protein